MRGAGAAEEPGLGAIVLLLDFAVGQVDPSEADFLLIGVAIIEVGGAGVGQQLAVQLGVAHLAAELLGGQAEGTAELVRPQSLPAGGIQCRDLVGPFPAPALSDDDAAAQVEDAHALLGPVGAPGQVRLEDLRAVGELANAERAAVALEKGLVVERYVLGAPLPEPPAVGG